MMLRLNNTRVTYIWLVLASLTLLSWWLADGHALTNPDYQKALTIGLLTIAFFKIRLVVMHFMEIRSAPWVLRGLLESWILLVYAILLFLYLFPA